MAMGLDRRQYSGEITVFVALSFMVGVMGGFIYGYDIIGFSDGVTSMRPFLEQFFPKVFTKMQKDTRISNYCKFDSQLLTTFTSSLYIAGLVASSVTTALGCRTSILIGGIAFLLGSALAGLASDVYTLIFGRVFLGFGIGFANQSVPLYLLTLAPSRLRGALNIGFSLCFAIGGLSANLINYDPENINGGWGSRISLLMAAIPASVLTLGALSSPETDITQFQRHNDHHNMRQSVIVDSDIQAELDSLTRASSILRTIYQVFKKIIQRKYRPELGVKAIAFFTHLTGITVIACSVPTLFSTVGIGVSESLMSTILTGVMATGSTFLSMCIVHKPGRRVLILVGGIQMFVSHIMAGGILAAQLGDHGGLSKRYAYLVLVLTCTFAAGFGFSWGPLSWLVSSKIQPLIVRSPEQSITVSMALLFTSVAAQTNLAMLCHCKSAIFFFPGECVLMTGFLFSFLS